MPHFVAVVSCSDDLTHDENSRQRMMNDDVMESVSLHIMYVARGET